MLNKALPKISIIIGVLNMQRYLGATLDSVIRQNYPNLELIVMDGGSTDGTLDIIKQYEAHISVWKSGKDKGHSDACNKAIEFATGDLIGLLNADDVYGDNLFHKVAKAYEESPEAKIITCGVTINNGKRVLQEITDPAKLQITLNNVLFELPVINARFFHKDIFTKFGQFQATHEDGSYNLSNDRQFFIKLALANIQSVIIPEALYHYLSHDDSLTFGQKNMIKSRKEHIQLAIKSQQIPGISISEKKLFQSWLIHESVYLSLIYLKQRKFSEMLSTIKFGITQCGLIWPLKFTSIFITSIFRKTKKLFFRFQ